MSAFLKFCLVCPTSSPYLPIITHFAFLHSYIHLHEEFLSWKVMAGTINMAAIRLSASLADVPILGLKE